MRRIVLLIGVLVLDCAMGSALYAQPRQTTEVLFENVRIFAGKANTLSAPANVLVSGNKIDKISTGPIPENSTVKRTVIQGDGKTLMPGLIDAHWHAMMAVPSTIEMMTMEPCYLDLLAGREAHNTLMRGFTSVRDLGGPSLGLKRAIDNGIIDGPRIWPAGAMISQTGGHGDFRLPYEIPKAPGAPLSHSEVVGYSALADSPDEVRLRAREQFMSGAVFLKLMAGGGVSSSYDPLDASQYTEAEFHAAVEVAENMGTYVAVHAYTPRAIQTAIRSEGTPFIFIYLQ